MSLVSNNVVSVNDVHNNDSKNFSFKVKRLFKKENTFGWALFIPSAILLILLGLIPTIYVLILSFSSYDLNLGITAIPLLDSYQRMLSDERFWSGLRVTGIMVFVGVGLQFVIGLSIAMALQKMSGWVQAFITSILIIPMLMPPVVVGSLWKMLLRQRTGSVSYIIESLGFNAIPWFESSFWGICSLIIAEVWEWTPFVTVILLAGLLAIPRSVYEAAELDGANKWTQFWKITLPMLRPIIALTIMLRVIDAFKSFDLVLVMTRGGPGSGTESIAYYTYIQGFTYLDFSLTAAMSIAQLLLVIIVGKQLWKMTSGS